MTLRKKIAAKCEKTLKSGADKETVDEYTWLCNNVRVLDEMFNCLKRVMEAGSPVEDKGELSERVSLLDAKRARLSELEKIIN